MQEAETAEARASECSPPSVSMPQVRDLATAARCSGYRVKGMACQLGCSCRWLELFCHRRFALTPHAWLARLRDEAVQQLARTGMPAKAICRLVGYADAASFCHGLKRSAGCTLRELRGLSRNERSQKDNKRGSPPVIRRSQSILAPRSGPCQGHWPSDVERWSGETKRKITRFRRQARLGHK